MNNTIAGSKAPEDHAEPYGFESITLGMPQDQLITMLSRRHRRSPQCQTEPNERVICSIHGIKEKPFIITFLSVPLDSATFEFKHNELSSMTAHLWMPPRKPVTETDSGFGRLSDYFTARYGPAQQRTAKQQVWRNSRYGLDLEQTGEQPDRYRIKIYQHD